MPALTVATGATPGGGGGRKASGGQPPAETTQPVRSSSPVRPSVSPITPPLNATQLPVVPPLPTVSGALPEPAVAAFGAGRPNFAHASQADMTQPGMSMVPPPAPAISFDENPDALALQSAISILQMQRAKATADMQALARAKRAAMADPRAFAADLSAGRVRTEGDRLFVEGGVKGSGGDAEEDSDDGLEEEEEEEKAEDGEADGQESESAEVDDSGVVKMETAAESSKQAESSAQGAAAAASKSAKARRKRKGKEKSSDAGPSRTAPAADAKAWRKLPKPQNVVRCPPINWTQYGVVGESLEKLHAEQRAAPTLGKPAVLGPGGSFEFRAGDPVTTGGQQRRLVSVAAPYAPGKDKLEKKKGKR